MSGPASAGVRVVFLGTPAFALPSLRALVEATTVVAVVTQRDRPAGRGRKLTAPPVAVEANRLGLPLLQPRTLRDATLIDVLRAHRPDLIATAAYGRIIPPEIIALPPLGCINVHPSLLPRYRGASPIQAAIANGDSTTGVTILYLTDDLDAGDIIAQREVPIGPEETAGELEERLAAVGAALVMETVPLIASGRAPRRPQDHAAATYVGRLSKEDGAIDWNRPARDLVNHVRAMNPWPSAHTRWRGGLLKVWRARASDGAGPPGTVLTCGDEGIVVATGDGVLILLEVQPEGGRRMFAAAFLRGHGVRAGDRMGMVPASAGTEREC